MITLSSSTLAFLRTPIDVITSSLTRFSIPAGEFAQKCLNIDYFPAEEYSPDPNDSTMAIPCKYTTESCSGGHGICGTPSRIRNAVSYPACAISRTRPADVKDLSDLPPFRRSSPWFLGIHRGNSWMSESLRARDS